MTFISETNVKATRKPAQCIGCLKMIEVGSPAIRWAGIHDGDFSSIAYHPECRAAEIEWNRLRRSFGDEWTNLNEVENDDHEWLLAEHPIVAARLGIADDANRAGSGGNPNSGLAMGCKL